MLIVSVQFTLQRKYSLSFNFKFLFSQLSLGKLKIKKWGKRRLTLELKKKNISKTNINQALTEIDDKEYIQIFNDLAEKRCNAIKEKDTYKKKKKLADYLLYRGWESFLVYDKVNELIK